LFLPSDNNTVVILSRNKLAPKIKAMKTNNKIRRGNFNSNMNYNTPNSSTWKFVMAIILLGFILMLGLSSASTCSSQETTEYKITVISEEQAEIESASNALEVMPDIFPSVPNGFTPN
jgi:hypothetical protein